MNSTYKIVAKNYETPNIEVTAEGDLFAVSEYATLLQKGFRFVEVYNNKTGEVVYTFYRSDAWFNPSLSVTECIALLKAKVKNNRAHY
jgi:hypothetical protein